MTVSTIMSKYRKGEKITMSTAYTYPEVGFKLSYDKIGYLRGSGGD